MILCFFGKKRIFRNSLPDKDGTEKDKLECINEQYPMGKIMKHAVAVNDFKGATDDKI